MSIVRRLFKENPMMAEPKRINGQLLGVGGWTPQHTAVASIAGVFYLILLGMTIRYATSFPPVAILCIMAAVILIVLPINLHSTIAGEREKRSLEMLLSAPVTSNQIVMAKLLRPLGLMCVTGVALGIPLVIALTAQSVVGQATFLAERAAFSPWAATGLALIVILCSSFASASVTLAISAHSKNAANSMLANLAVHFSYLVIFPVLTAFVLGIFPMASWLTAVYWFHPIGALNLLGLLGTSQFEMFGTGPLAAFASMVVLTLALVGWIVIGFVGLRMAAARLDRERRL